MNKQKSEPCRLVLRLMDKNISYERALKIALIKYNVTSKADLEKELNLYI